MSNLQAIIHRFKQHGYKMTPQRRAILQTLLNNASHPTAEQLYHLVQDQIPGISLATVYNTLRELAAIQEVRELDLSHRERHFEIWGQAHAHQVCLKCGQVCDLTGDLAQVQALFQTGDQFVPVQSTVTIYGYCVDHAPSTEGH